MKAILDHVGIAVRDLDEAVRFYRDALGLEIEPAEEVASQRVRAYSVPAGEARLELLEATAADSPIARFVEKRGPGLHHITLRVDDLEAALAHLQARGVRLIDERPRPGAGRSLIAFVHPSAAHGVLIELKQGAPDRAAASGAPVAAQRPEAARPVSQTTAAPEAALAVRYSLGALELISVSDGFFRLDGGAMFGIVPRPLWAPKAPPDDRNRITLAMRPLIVRGARTMIIDAGVGDKEGAKFSDIYGLDRTQHLDHALAAAGLAPSDIDLVLATHLHFDHAGGFTRREADGRLRPRFPRAQYVVRRGEWEDATHPTERTRASYLADNFAPLAEAGVLLLVDDDQTIMPGVRVRRTGGHTKHHQMVIIESGGRTAFYVADLIPTTAHVPEAWIMGYDLYPVETLETKKAVIREAIAREALVFFEHDPAIAAGYLADVDGKRQVVPAAPARP